jgi:hypothetical protein
MKSGYRHTAVVAAMLLMAQAGPLFAQDNNVSPAPTVPQSYGPAPKAAAPVLPPKDGKVRKEQRRKKQTDSDNCLSKSVSVVGRPLIPLFTQGENSTRAVRVAPATGLSSCDAVLALPVDSDDAWDRRAQLLQGRATHLIALGAYDAALQSLDEADAIGGSDMLFTGSTGIGNSMLRAFVLGQQGKRTEALAVISRGRKVRPHSTGIDRGFDRIENHINNSADYMLDNAASKIRWQPDLMRMLLPLYIWRGNLKAAGNFVDDVSTVNPKPIGGWTISGAQTAGQQLEDDIDMQMQRAYVWAGLGNSEKSKTIIDAARADVTEFVGTAPVAERGKKVSKSKQADYDARVRVGEYVSMLITRWEGAMQLRADTKVKPAEDLFEKFKDLNIIDLAASLDIMRQLQFSSPAGQQGMASMIRKTDADISGKMLKLEPQDLRTILPEPEYLSQVPRFGTAGDGILFGRENGISQSREKDSEVRTVRFGTTSGSGPMAEELSLLAIAQYAQKEGKDSFILLARRSIKRTTTVSGYYTPQYSFDSGYESQARVILLDSKNLPPEWAGKTGRLIMVKQILDEIKPRYDTLEALKNADKAKKKT